MTIDEKVNALKAVFEPFRKELEKYPSHTVRLMQAEGVEIGLFIDIDKLEKSGSSENSEN
ncbi:MAG: hypothetical protein KBC56_08140 [Flavobacterium sp.]|nr:hypothetical protein [Flavobacterium sp.]